MILVRVLLRFGDCILWRYLDAFSSSLSFALVDCCLEDVIGDGVPIVLVVYVVDEKKRCNYYLFAFLSELVNKS